MKHTLLSTTAAALTFFATGATAASGGLTEEDVNALIGQYIKDNPQAIIDSLQAYQVNQEAKRNAEQSAKAKELLPLLTSKDMHYGRGGNPDGDVTIVEFFDYNCPACEAMFNSLEAALADDKNLNIIFVEMPIFGPISDENAKISMAVNALNPEKYFLFHQAAMKHKGKISPEQMLRIAEGLGIDKAQLQAEAARGKYVELMASDREIAAKLSVRGTPALLINGEFIGGALYVDQLKEKIAQARRQNKQK